MNKSPLFLTTGILLTTFQFFSLQSEQMAQVQPQETIQPTTNVKENTTFNPVSELLNYPLIPERALEILDFWFGYLPNVDFFPKEKIPLWFNGDSSIDKQITNLFSEDVEKASRGELNSWRETARGRLALLLLLDQFPRHIYRNKPQAYALDPMARGLVQEGLSKQDDKKLYPIEKVFFYLPLEHAEDPQLQSLSVQLFQQLVSDSPDKIQPQMAEFYRYALQHQQQIQQFGRFPHRNQALGRKSSSDEIRFLKGTD